MPASDILKVIGNTPIVELHHCSPNPGVRLFAKLEGLNPTGSVKDRIAREMVLRAKADGRLRPGDTIVVASTGNTGIVLAMVGRALAHSVWVVMPGNVAPDIPRALAAFGAAIEWAPEEKGMRGAIEAAQALGQRQGWPVLDQFSDPYNVQAHYDTTATEILRDLASVDVFIAGLGTGGTLMGVGRSLKEANPKTQVIAVEPNPGSQVQGLKSLADGFIPAVLDLDLLDGRILVRSRDAFRATAALMQREGVFAGISSGAVLHAALRLAERLRRGNVLLLFADSGWKYLPTNVWSNPPEPGEGEDLDDILWW